MTLEESHEYKPSIHDVQFDDSICLNKGKPSGGRARLWQTQAGDDIGLYLVPLPPDLPRDTSVFKTYAHYYQGFLRGSKGSVIQSQKLWVGGCLCIMTLYTLPQAPSGTTYVGMILMPFEQFNYVWKCQCEEKREAGQPEPVLPDHGAPIPHVDVMGQTQQLPNHAASRARAILDHLVKTTTISKEILALPRFALAPGLA